MRRVVPLSMVCFLLWAVALSPARVRGARLCSHSWLDTYSPCQASAHESQYSAAEHCHPYGAARAVMMRSLMRNRHVGIRRRFLVHSVLILYVLVSVAALACGASAESVQHRHHAAPLTHSSHSLLCNLCLSGQPRCRSVCRPGGTLCRGLLAGGIWLCVAFLASYPRQWRFVRGPPSPVLFF